MKKNYQICCLILIYLFVTTKTFCQTDISDIYSYDFKQLSQVQVTTASKSPEKIEEIPATIHIISASEIKEKGYFTIEEALSDLPGFQFRNIVGFNSNVFQRGIPNQNNLILMLIDGVQVNELSSGGFYAGGMYNMSNIERIEVVCGPSSVAYGSNAVSGIINIITKKARDTRFRISSSAGTFNTLEANSTCNYLSEDKSFGIRASAMVKKSEKADLKGAEGDNNWSDLMENFDNNYSFDLKIDYNELSFGANFMQKNSSMTTYMKSTGTNYNDYGTLWNISFLNTYLKYGLELNKQLSMHSMLYFRDATVLDNSVMYVVDTAQIGCYRPNNLFGFENIMYWTQSDIFTLVGGLTLEYERLAEGYSYSISASPMVKPPTPASPAMNDNTLGSIFIEPRLALFNSLYVSAGLRYDHSSVYDDLVTPRAGIIYKFLGQNVRISYSEAFRAPKPWDYTDGLGNSLLVPERMRSIEAALAPNIIENLKINLIGYKNRVENALNKVTVADNYRWVNEGEINTEGIGVLLSYSTSNIKAALNYTYNNSFYEDGEIIPEIAKHCANASVSYAFDDNLILNLRANYIGEKKNTKLITSTDSYFVEPCVVFHLAMSLLDYKGITAQFIVKNLFDTEYYHTSNRPPDRYRQPQRNLMLTLGYTLID